MALIRRPSKIVCVGRNYVAHAAEFGNEVPSEPLIFLKPPSSVIGPGDPIVLPPSVGEVHYEGEIGVLIGRRASWVEENVALDYVEAVVPVNDVTARTLQRKDNQWSRAKGFDTFCPVGDPKELYAVDLDVPHLLHLQDHDPGARGPAGHWHAGGCRAPHCRGYRRSRADRPGSPEEPRRGPRGGLNHAP